MKQLSFYIKDTKHGRLLRHESMKSSFSCKVLGTTIINNGYVLLSKAWHGGQCDGGVTDADHNYISSTGYTSTAGCGYEFNDKDVELVNKKCIFIGSIHPVYGHAITDTLRKLWFLKTDKGQRFIEEEGYIVTFITTKNSELPQWQMKIFDLAGIDSSILVHIRETTQFKTIIVPDDSLFSENNIIEYTKEFRSTIDEIKNNALKKSLAIKSYPENLYFTRENCSLLIREMGEPYIENIFKEQGFTIVAPETYPIEEQIAMLVHCKRFAATESSCSHAAIFCNKDCEVIILRKADYVNKYSLMIADFVGNNTVFVDANQSIRTNPTYPMIGPFFMCVTSELQHYLNTSKTYSVGAKFLFLIYNHANKKPIHYAIRAYDKFIRRGLLRS